MIPILSFFTGAGLMDIGFARAGLVPIWHNEIEPWFIRGFEMGMSSMGADPVQATIQNRDSIVDVTPERILDEAFGGSAPDVFGVIGGPPFRHRSSCASPQGHHWRSLPCETADDQNHA